MPFKGINNLRSWNETVKVERWQLDEIRKCAKDPIYFITKYVYINTKDHGVQLFKLRDYQESLIKKFHTYRFSIVRFPRQSGKSATTMGYLLWFSIFHRDKTVVILANKLSLSQEQLENLKNSYINLPYWMQPGIRRWANRSIQVSHGTRVVCYATSPDAVRGMAIDCVVGDTEITVRDKKTKEIKKMTMLELYNDLNTEENILDVNMFDLQQE